MVFMVHVESVKELWNSQTGHAVFTSDRVTRSDRQGADNCALFRECRCRDNFSLTDNMTVDAN